MSCPRIELNRRGRYVDIVRFGNAKVVAQHITGTGERRERRVGAHGSEPNIRLPGSATVERLREIHVYHRVRTGIIATVVKRGRKSLAIGRNIDGRVEHSSRGGIITDRDWAAPGLAFVGRLREHDARYARYSRLINDVQIAGRAIGRGRRQKASGAYARRGVGISGSRNHHWRTKG